MAKQLKPTRISVRPCNNLEGQGIVVWIYHRKAQVQLVFEDFPDVESCINEALGAWYYAMIDLKR